jgi:hypothetical protein
MAQRFRDVACKLDVRVWQAQMRLAQILGGI